LSYTTAVRMSAEKSQELEMLLEDQPQLHLLVVDADPETRSACVEIARRMRFVVVQAASLAAAQAIVKQQQLDVVLVDLRLPGSTHEAAGGLSLLAEVKALQPAAAVIVMSASATVSSAVEVMRTGAQDHLTKPFALGDLVRALQRAAKANHVDRATRELRERMRSQRAGGPLVGHSPEMEKLYRILSKVAGSTHPVLILGETGTGKELVARSIHFYGPNADKPFVAVDCQSLAPELMEGELFGYVRGEIPAGIGSGLESRKDGLLVSAGGGTVFLDEISELPMDLQAKLVRVLQDRAVRPVGGTYAVPISCRVLAATRIDLAAMVEQGRFRRDLYFRLNVVSLRIPSLRARREDIPELAGYFLEKMRREKGSTLILSDDVLRLMMAYPWPGNVRELEAAITRMCKIGTGPVAQVSDLPSPLIEFHAAMRAGARPAEETAVATTAGLAKIQSIAEREKRAILETIQQLKGDKLLAAKLLGIGKTTLYRKLKEYGVHESGGFA
jgi:two-component system response regulator HydG